ncbi:glutaminase A [Phormidium sp. LEGE 05292]|uniref:glutaminase A n=1 Tax=[Phormidium] sp. LEGE 05292 TaxID=767427 RepID=UPI001881402A|nr:glutaminase A [Phormidium sp. LEGE 05292]MBE9225982.1 glutaminase A [Phormidium sp. LEGE 05292]
MMNSAKLSNLTQEQLEGLAVQARSYSQGGRLPDYIPLLAQVNPEWFAVQINCTNGQIFRVGETEIPFVLMSVIKPFVLLCLLEEMGREAVFSHVGMQPSDQPFFSIEQLEADKGWPRNPMINSGAIALASLLPGADGFSRCENLRQWLNKRAGANLVLDKAMLNSVVAAGGGRNRSIAKVMFEFGFLNAPEIAIDTYNHICCLAGNISDLAKLGMLLAQEKAGISREHRRIVNALMMNCGLYEASASFAVKVGLPTKSGVSGALLSIVPSAGAIACYSPALDYIGNSKAGIFFLEKFTNSLNLSVFI